MSDLITEINVETGEIIERPRTNEEQSTINLVREEIQTENDALQNKIIQRQALLEKLGITEEEAKLLLS